MLTRSLVFLSRTVKQFSAASLVARRQFCFSTAALNRIYSQRHEWVVVDENRVGTVGITDHAQDALGELVYVQLPDVGADLKAGDDCGALESVKAASEIYSPVTGKVVEKNNTIEDDPKIINSSPYDEGWLYKIKIGNPSELTDLMNEEQYKQFVEESS